MLAFVQGAPARAEEVEAGDLVIREAWTRATPKGAKIGGGYLTIENKGTAPDRLIGSSADIAGSVQVHEMSMDKGVMKMRPLENGLAIEPGKTVKLTPGGYHLMMMDLKSPIKKGDKLPLTLEFEKAGKVQVSLDVEGVGAPEADCALPVSGAMKGSGRHVARDEDVRIWVKGDTRKAAKRRSLVVAELPRGLNDI